MATPKQIAANKANAQKSCGPKSPETKAKVSQNRTTHGLCGKFAVLPCEDQELFDQLVAAMMEAEKPADASEIELVVKMAEHSWRARRALRMQDACFSMEPRDKEDEAAGIHNVGVALTLERHVRYHAAHDRAYRRAAQELMERRKQRQLAEIGFERKRQAEADEKRKAEKHEVTMAIATLKKQTLEIKVEHALAAILPPDFDLQTPFSTSAGTAPTAPSMPPQRASSHMNRAA
jgi:hypothetical protein